MNVKEDANGFSIKMEKEMYKDWFSSQYLKEETSVKEIKKQQKSMLLKIIQNELPEKEREYFILYFYNNMTVSDIAKKFGVNKSTVSRQLKRAVTTVRRFAKYLSAELYAIIEEGSAPRISFYSNRKHQNRSGRLG